MEFHDAIVYVVTHFGKESIFQKRSLYILDDLGAFSSIPGSKTVYRENFKHLYTF